MRAWSSSDSTNDETLDLDDNHQNSIASKPASDDANFRKDSKHTDYVPPPYPSDENGRPIDLRGNDLLVVPTAAGGHADGSNNHEMVNLQTPHSARKFRPTHPSFYKSESKLSRLQSRLRHILQPWRRRKHETPIHTTNGNNDTKRKLSKRRNSRKNSRRFTEGWYYRLTLPPPINESFVFIFSIEDAGRWIRDDRVSKSSFDKGFSEDTATDLSSADASHARSNSSKQKMSRKGRILQCLRPKYVKSPLSLACMQLLGPQDTYLVQSDEDDTKFWGWKYSQGFGCNFEWKGDGRTEHIDGSSQNEEDVRNIAAMTPEEWRERVESGFQIMPFHLQVNLIINICECQVE